MGTQVATQRCKIIRVHPGFTLVELLTVITIIGLLLTLLLPAVQAAREAARRLQCANHIKQLSLAAMNHESVAKFFPTGGWDRTWLGHPDRGFGKTQPGGWIYNILPFIDQQALYDLGGCNSTISIQDANTVRLATPLAILNCPSRRSAALYKMSIGIPFKLTNGVVNPIARSDYAMNAGDWIQWHIASPSDLAEGDQPGFHWDDMSQQTGISHQRSQVTVADILDGTSNTFLIGEKYVNSDHYTDGKCVGDLLSMYCGGDNDLLRWTGINGGVGTSTDNNLPVQDRSTVYGEGNEVQWFGSAHAEGFNMSFCDGSVRTISYSIGSEVYRCLGNRKDGQPLNGSQY